MNRLYWRIFLSFWLALGLILVITVTVAARYAAERARALDSFAPETLVSAASSALAEDGEDGLRRLLQRRGNDGGLVVYVLDADGTDLLGRKLPGRAGRLAQRIAERRGPPPPPNFRPPHRMPRFVGPDGSLYTMLILPQRLGWFGILGLGGVPLTVLASALAVSAVVCFFLARHIAAPVRRLQGAARALADGDLAARVAEDLGRRRDEIGDLGRDFDTMAGRLQELLASRQRLLRDISHELRSPLARIRVALELARRKGSGDGDELARIEHEAERLDGLIGQVLQLSRLDDGGPPARLRPVDLTSLLDALADDARMEAQAAGRSVLREPAAPLEVQADATLLRSALENVLRNAIRYTAADTAVEITQARRGAMAVVSVRDHGPGVPEAELRRIFEPFHRVADARERDSGGEGIGLAITARVASLHRGTVTARNVEGGGLQVDFELPVAGTVKGHL